VSARGVPTFLRSDNGPEFVSKALLSWIFAQGVGTALIDPGKPWQKWRDGKLPAYGSSICC
jgi:putative transposase